MNAFCLQIANKYYPVNTYQGNSLFQIIKDKDYIGILNIMSIFKFVGEINVLLIKEIAASSVFFLKSELIIEELIDVYC
jgi:hypothetical protein